MSINLLRNSKVYFTTNVDTVAPNIGKINLQGFSSVTPNCWEIQVLDDLSFSQTTAVETIGVNETGTAPIRGQRTFNTALNPVDFNFTTYMRPNKSAAPGKITQLTVTLVGGANAGVMSGDNSNTVNFSLQFGTSTQITVAAPAGGRAAVLYPVFATTASTEANSGKLVGFAIADGGSGYTAGQTLSASVFDPDSGAENTESFTFEATAVSGGASTAVDAEESVLWNAMFGTNAIGVANSAWTKGSGSDPAVCQLTNSNKHQLQRFGIIVIFDSNVFLLDDCSLNTATIDFGIDAIASIQWSGQARAIRRLAAPVDTSGAWSGSGTLNGTYIPKVTSAPFIANKLSSVTLVSKIGSYGSSPDFNGSPDGTGTTYTMPLTGGSITLTNNITYLTPAYMGTINQPITYFTGSRSVTGSLTAYLRTGSGSGGSNYSANLFSDLINQVNTDSDPEFYLQVEIGGATGVHVDLEMPGAVLTIPTVNAESVITTTVNFTAQGTDSSKFDILQNNEIMIKYYAD